MGFFLEYPLGLMTQVDTYVRPSIHQAMLEDGPRSEGFLTAIRQVVGPNDIVLDIGSGSGVLAMSAARAGAKKVYAIEASELAPVTKQIVADNGLAGAIEVIEGLSFDIDLPQRATVLVSEMLGHIGIDEAILATFRDARKRLLTEDAKLIPSDVTLLATPVFSAAFENETAGYWEKPHFELDMRAMKEVVHAMSYVTVPLGYARAGHAERLCYLPLTEDWNCPLTFGKTLELQPGCTANGVILQFESRLSPEVVLKGVECSHWKDIFLPLPEQTKNFSFHLGFEAEDAPATWSAIPLD